MSSTDVSFLFDCPFNKEVGKDCAFYFDQNENSLSDLVDKNDGLPKNERISLGLKAKKNMEENYSWEKIVSQYSSLFSSI